MSQQQDTLDQLNTARDALTKVILLNTAVQGTQEWTKLEKTVEDRDLLTLQINDTLNANFPVPTAQLTDAIASLAMNTKALTKLDQTLAKLDQIIALADTIVQIGASIVQVVAPLV